MRLGAVFWAGLLWSVACAAAAMEGRVVSLSVSEQDRSYVIKADVLVAVSLTSAWHLVTDYPNLGRLNDAIKKGELLVRKTETQHLVRVDVEACVLFYCKQLVMVQDIYQQPQSQLLASIVAAQSSFSFGEANLQMQFEEGKTRMRLHARVTPKFWVPPYIGTWLLEWKLRSEARDTIGNMEQLARSHPLTAGR